MELYLGGTQPIVQKFLRYKTEQSELQWGIGAGTLAGTFLKN
jgi:hypothetical protein